MCVAFKKVQSDDPQTPDSLGNTFTKAGEEGETQPPFDSLDYSPLSPHSLGGGKEHPEHELPGCCLPQERPLCNLQSLLLVPLMPTAAPGMLLLPTEPWERGLLCHPPALPAPTAACQPQPLKNRADTCMLQCKSSRETVLEKGLKLSFQRKLN